MGVLFGFLKTRCLIVGVSDTESLCQTQDTLCRTQLYLTQALCKAQGLVSDTGFCVRHRPCLIRGSYVLTQLCLAQLLFDTALEAVSDIIEAPNFLIFGVLFVFCGGFGKITKARSLRGRLNPGW